MKIVFVLIIQFCLTPLVAQSFIHNKKRDSYVFYDKSNKKHRKVKYNKVFEFIDGFSIVGDKNKKSIRWGLLNQEGVETHATIYDTIVINDGEYFGCINNAISMLNPKGGKKIPFDFISFFIPKKSNGNEMIIMTKFEDYNYDKITQEVEFLKIYGTKTVQKDEYYRDPRLSIRFPGCELEKRRGSCSSAKYTKYIRDAIRKNPKYFVQQDRMQIVPRIKFSDTGDVVDVELIIKTNTPMDAAFVKILKDMPAWIPARYNEKRVFFRTTNSFRMKDYIPK